MTLTLYSLTPSNAEATFAHKNAKIFENHLNPVMCVFIGQLSLSDEYPFARIFGDFSDSFALFCIGGISFQQHEG